MSMKIFNKHLWITLFLIFTVIVLQAVNQPGIERITTSNGLSHNNIHCLLQDKSGFIWLGTENGLDRYDGVRIRNIKSKPENGLSVSGSNISYLYEDRRGHIWIQTNANIVYCYDPVRERFISLNDGNHTQPVKGKFFFEDKQENIWLVTTGDGVIRYSFRDGKISSTIFSGNNRQNRIASNYITDNFENGFELNGKLYFITTGGYIEIFNLRSQRFENPVSLHLEGKVLNGLIMGKDRILLSTRNSGIWVFNTITKQCSPGETIFGEKISGTPTIATDNTGGIWVSNHTGNAWYLNTPNGKVNKLNLIPSSILAFIDNERFRFQCDKQGNVWISTFGNGLFCYNRQSGNLSHFAYDKSKPNTLSSNYLQTILIDKDENIWVGSSSVGLNKLSVSHRNENTFLPSTETTNENSNAIRAFLEDRSGKIWVASKAGSIYQYDPGLNTPITLIPNGPKVYSLLQDKAGSVWLGTRGQGVIELKNGNINQAVNYKHSNIPGSLSSDDVFSILKDRKERLWVATFGNGICVKITSEGTAGFRTFFDKNPMFNMARYLYMDRKGDIWVGTSNGVLRFNPDALLRNPKAFRYYTTEPGNTNSLSNPKVYHIFQDSKGTIWLATAGGGLNRFDGESADGKGIFRTFTIPQSKASNNIMSIQEGGSGDLWVGTENGLFRFSPQTGLFHAQEFSNELMSNIFLESAALTCRSGRMLWGSLNGFYAFFPNELNQNISQKDKVTLTGFSIFDEEAEVGESKAPLKQSVSFANQVILKASDKVFHIEFANLNFKNPATNQYMYILENYEKRWNISGAYNVATYRNIPPGKYTFKVKMVDSEGQVNEQVTAIEIIIRPPFWLTWWAYLLYLILLGAAGYFTFRVITKIQRLNSAVRMERQLTEYKLHFFTNISHEFRTPLTLIKGSVDTLKELKAKMAEPMLHLVNGLDKNTTHLMRLLDQLLEFRKLQNNRQKLNLQQVDAVSFLKEIFISFSDVALRTNVEYEFLPSEASIMVYLDRNKVDKIVLNLLSNAFKFTPRGGRIMLITETDHEAGVLRISVSDNGIGIPKEKQHLLFSRFMQINFSASGTGIGLSLVNEFTALHKGTVRFEENEGGGSLFTVELPLNEKVYQPEDFVNEQVVVAREGQKEAVNLSEFIENDGESLLNLLPNTPSAETKYKVLVIDDNDDIRDFLNEKLNPYFEVITAEDGDTGIQKSMEEDPDLIICDVMMPGMNGFDLTRRLKENFETCHIPVILLTAYIADEHNSEGIEAGADAYITKPFSMSHLLLQINKLLEKRELLRKHYAGNANTTELEFLKELPDKDSKFLQLIETLMEKHLDNPEFNVDRFAHMANLGRTIFYKKVKSLTGYTPNEFIRNRRMKKAAELLASKEYNVSEVAYKVGINDPLYFSKCFKAQYGCSPSRFPEDYKQVKTE